MQWFVYLRPFGFRLLQRFSILKNNICKIWLIYIYMTYCSCLAKQCWTMLRLSPFLENWGIYANESSYKNPPWHILPTAIDYYWPWPTFHRGEQCLVSAFSSISRIPRSLRCWHFIQTCTIMHPAHCHRLFLRCTYFLREQCITKTCLYNFGPS